MVKFVMRIIPEGKTQEAEPADTVYLDDRLMAQPAAALSLVAKEILRVSDIVKELLKDASAAARREEPALLDAISKKAKTVKSLTGKITEYLGGLFSAGVLTEDQANQAAGIMYVLSDVERMGLLCNDIAESLQDKMANKYKYSKDAMKDLEKSLKVIEEMYGSAVDVMTTGNPDSIKKIRKRREKALDLDIEMRKGHMDRVSKGKCAVNMTAPLNDILHSVDRMGNCCVNIAEAALGRADLTYFIQSVEDSPV